MNNIKHNPKHRSTIDNENVVYEYFRLIKNKDIDGALNLFEDDAIIYEPFSNIDEGLQGKGAIRSFLEVAMMASDGLRHDIEFVKAQDGSSDKGGNQVRALVTFERGERAQGRFTFELTSEQEQYDYREREKKIRILQIEFIK